MAITEYQITLGTDRSCDQFKLASKTVTVFCYNFSVFCIFCWIWIQTSNTLLTVWIVNMERTHRHCRIGQYVKGYL